MQAFRFLVVSLTILTAMLAAGCEFWPRNLEQLAQSIGQKVSAETTAWLAGGDVVVIDVAGSPLNRAPRDELEIVATGIAEQAIAFVDVPLESVVVSFHAGEASANPDKPREFIFLVVENRPVLQPAIDLDATGALTAEEIQAAMSRIEDAYESLGKPIAEEHRECLLAEVEQRARDAGDPEQLDPASVELLPTRTWPALDAFGKRLALVQAITTKALFVCVSTETTG